MDLLGSFAAPPVSLQSRSWSTLDTALYVTETLKNKRVNLTSQWKRSPSTCYPDIFRHFPTRRIMSENVGNCRKLSENVGKCRKMSENVGIFFGKFQKMTKFFFSSFFFQFSKMCFKGVFSLF